MVKRGKRIVRLLWLVGSVIVLGWSCSSNNVGTSASNPSTNPSHAAFPQGLIVASSLKLGEVNSGESRDSVPRVSIKTDGSESSRTVGEAIREEIEAILNGDEITDCTWNPRRLLEIARKANCYGPPVQYKNHPDYDPAFPPPTGVPGGEDGTLPGADTGIWSETNARGEACAAAQDRMIIESLEGKTTASLEAFASLHCVARSNGISPPGNGESIDLTAEMNEMAEENSLAVEFDNALLTREGAVYDYRINGTFTDLMREEHEFDIFMTHKQTGDVDTVYEGHFWYLVGDNIDMVNCTKSEMTHAGAIFYDRNEGNEVTLRADAAFYCSGDGDNIVGDDDTLDPNDSILKNSEGWSDSYTVHQARYQIDSETGAIEGEGTTSVAWQAGAGDSHSRIFNIFVEKDPAAGILAGRAYFGFGDQIQSSSFDGAIDGFICNWAGPGQNIISHNTLPYVQYQGVSELAGEDLFGSDEAHILYAPTNRCSYDPAVDGAGFEYDMDGDQTIEASEIADIADGVTHDLLSIDEMVFELPPVPEGF